MHWELPVVGEVSEVGFVDAAEPDDARVHAEDDVLSIETGGKELLKLDQI